MTISDRERFLVTLAYHPTSNADTIVCLAGEEGESRAHYAASLFKHRLRPDDPPVASGILVTGGRDNPPHVGALLTTTLLYGKGIAHNRIITDARATNTREQAINTVATAVEKGWKRLLIVASSWHAPRAYLTFLAALQEAGVTDVCLVPAAVQSPAFADRLDGELAKIDAYGPHCASYADGLAELARWAR
jgi:uncharacterized SAM-binding protein YcdF (DUF218 family)